MTESHQTYELVPDAEIQQTSFRERMACSRIGRAAIGGITAVSLAVGGTVATAAPSVAESSHTYTVTGTGGEGVWLHDDPGAGDEGDLIKIMPEGTQFTADCYVNDTPIGERSNPVWLHGRDASGVEGYFTDYYSSSRWSAEDKSDLPPLCGEQSESYVEPRKNNLQGHEASPTFTGEYNRERAVSWARANAQMQPPADGSCTWFASNVLWQGGLPKTDEWTSEGAYGNKFKTALLGSELSGTYAAWNVQAFNAYLRDTYPKSTWRELDFARNVVPEARPGSLIFYDWGKGEGISHVSVVVDIAPGQYPEVAEWSAGPDGSEGSEYVSRGWTRSEVSKMWLQEKHPHIKAYILDINTDGMKLNP